MKGGNKFSQVPEWVLDSDISDGAFRLYAALLRYADQNTGNAFPSRATLAKRLSKTPKSIDRYLKELSGIGALVSHARFENGQQKSNNYTVVTRNPSAGGATHMSPPSTGGATHMSSPISGGRPTDVQGGGPHMSALGATQMSHRTRPIERDPLNEEGADSAARPEPSPDVIQGELLPAEKPQPKKKSLEHQATDDAYEKCGKAFNYVAVLGIAKWLTRDRGLPPERASLAIVTVYQMGKPITKQVVGQLIDGHIRPGGSSRPTTSDRIQQTAAIGHRLQAQHDAEQQKRIGA